MPRLEMGWLHGSRDSSLAPRRAHAFSAGERKAQSSELFKLSVGLPRSAVCVLIFVLVLK